MRNRLGWVICGAFVCGYLAARGSIGGPAGAAPADVHGAVGVAVAGYQTSKGSYVLWSDGHISNAVSGATVNAAPETTGAYTPVSGVTASTFPKSAMVGSPWVAVSTLPLPTGTDILFSNGAVMKPSDSGAGAGNSSTGARYVDFSGSSPQNPKTGTGGITYVLNKVSFDPPFAAPPLVLAISFNLAAGPAPQVATWSSTTDSATAPTGGSPFLQLLIALPVSN
jgi:hypothetical protein